VNRAGRELNSGSSGERFKFPGERFGSTGRNVAIDTRVFVCVRSKQGFQKVARGRQGRDALNFREHVGRYGKMIWF
jgi:hypothetical protein